VNVDRRTMLRNSLIAAAAALFPRAMTSNIDRVIQEMQTTAQRSGHVFVRYAHNVPGWIGYWEDRAGRVTSWVATNGTHYSSDLKKSWDLAIKVFR
jgi:hypothetical protein